MNMLKHESACFFCGQCLHFLRLFNFSSQQSGAEKKYMGELSKLQIKEKGKREGCGLPTELANSFANYKFYRDRLHSVTRDMYQIMNGHSKFRQDENSNFDKPVHAPSGLSQADNLAKAVGMLDRHAWEQELLEYEAAFCNGVRDTELRFQDRGHFVISHIRDFLVEQYPKVLHLKEELIRIDHHLLGIHGQIDEHTAKIAEHQKEIGQLQPLQDDGKDDPKVPTKIAAVIKKEHTRLVKELEKEEKKLKKEEAKLNETRQTYKNKLDGATQLLGQSANEQRHNHLKDLREFMRIYKEYHQAMKKAHRNEALAQHRPAMYHQPLPKKEGDSANADGRKKKGK